MGSVVIKKENSKNTGFVHEEERTSRESFESEPLNDAVQHEQHTTLTTPTFSSRSMNQRQHNTHQHNTHQHNTHQQQRNTHQQQRNTHQQQRTTHQQRNSPT